MSFNTLQTGGFMKKLKVLIMCLLSTLFLTGIAFGQITGSAHDFSGEGWNSSGEICIVCHTPHNADITVTDAPLWNHEMSTATYTLYSGYTIDATIGQPTGNSKLCLCCHDGTVALDNFGGATGGTSFITSGNVGIDLSDDHPVSFNYDAALVSADGELQATDATSGLGGTIAEDMLFNDVMQCASCHDVHDNAHGSFLLKSNTASELCLTCHIK